MDASKIDAGDRALDGDEVGRLRQALDEQEQRSLRLLADFDNLRRRTRARAGRRAPRGAAGGALAAPVRPRHARARARRRVHRPRLLRGDGRHAPTVHDGAPRGGGRAHRQRRATVRSELPRGGGDSLRPRAWSPGRWSASCGAAGGSVTSCCARPRSWSPRPRRRTIRGGEVPGLLRGARCAAHREAGRDQEGLPPARAQASSGSSAARRARQGRRAVQGDQRGLRGPERSGQARQVRRARRELEGRDGLHAAARGRRGRMACRRSVLVRRGRERVQRLLRLGLRRGARAPAGDEVCGSRCRAATSRPSCR